MELTPREFFLALKDQEDGEVAKIRPICDSIRKSTWYLLNIQLKKRIKSPERLWRHPWEGKSVKKPQSLQEMKNVMQSIVSGTKNKRKKKKNHE